MDEVTHARSLTFNGPLEAGLRAVAILGAAFPKAFDIQRMTAFDYLLVHTSQLGGPADLHPDSPIRAPATQVRRRVVQDGIHLMMTRDLIARETNDDGIVYRAGEAAAIFLDSLQAPYLREMCGRAGWLVHHLARYTDQEFDALMRRFFDQWLIEFQQTEQSLGAEA
ncbi:MAG: threonine transporter [Sphingomonas sp.]|uniref:ABC-three component system middle component 2 n=1 Tax=Sphingomonas sp. TaxID=28214 RepID=UPI0011F48878|nr:ABC-three component system middle component 2 [Sphingomonas sp.]THD36700.1 MAG: threonine transporter [Sphingomonas sp.]